MKENTVSREVVVALLSQNYKGDKSVGEFVINLKNPIRDSEGHCIGYAVYTLNDLCERNPADEWMELAVRAIHNELYSPNYRLAHLLCRDIEMLTKGYYTDYYKKSIIEDILYYYNSLVEAKAYDVGDIGHSVYRMSEGELYLIHWLYLVGCDSFTKEVYNIMRKIQDIYSENPDGSLDYFLGFSMSEEEFIQVTKRRLIHTRTIREV